MICRGKFRPLLKPKDQWYAVDLATTGFGQGISVTPIELLDAVAAIANGGVRMQPQVVIGRTRSRWKYYQNRP